jgi:hypothetical protein
MKEGNLFTVVSDNKDDHHLYSGSPINKRISFRSVLNLEDLKGYSEYKKSFKEHKELKKKNRRWDLEGIASCGKNIYLINERVREVVVIKNRETVEQLPIDFSSAYPDLGKGGSNAGFEGIAIDCKAQHLYVAKERDPRQLFKIDLKTNKIIKQGDFNGSNRLGRTAINPWTGDGLINIGLDIADMYFDKGALYVLERNSYEITKLNPQTFKIIDRKSYYFAEHLLYEPTEPFGSSEAIFLTSDRIYVGIDNNGAPLSTKSTKRLGVSGSFGSVMIFRRPSGF